MGMDSGPGNGVNNFEKELAEKARENKINELIKGGETARGFVRDTKRMNAGQEIDTASSLRIQERIREGKQGGGAINEGAIYDEELKKRAEDNEVSAAKLLEEEAQGGGIGALEAKIALLNKDEERINALRFSEMQALLAVTELGKQKDVEEQFKEKWREEIRTSVGDKRDVLYKELSVAKRNDAEQTLEAAERSKNTEKPKETPEKTAESQTNKIDKTSIKKASWRDKIANSLKRFLGR